MTQEQQDLAWACLPKEVRNNIRSDYEYYLNRYRAVNSNTSKGAIDVLEDLFGSLNLTSDTEPSELLFVEKKKVQELHKRFLKYKAEESLKGDTDFYNGELNALNILFGDKCLPDKEWEDTGSGATSTTSPVVKLDVKPTPRFNKGDRVISKADNNIVCIVEYQSPITGLYQLDIGGRAVIHRSEECLAPYTEENKESMEEIKDYPPYLDRPKNIIPTEKNRCEKCGANAQQCADAPCQNYPMKEKEYKPILPGDLIEIKGKEQSLKAVVTELTDNKYVKVQPIGLTCSIYVEKEILKRDNPELYGK